VSGLAVDLAGALDPVVFARRAGFDAEPWQQAVMRSTARRLMLACARQVGKTETTAIRTVRTAVYEPEALCLFVSKSQRQSDEVLKRCRAIWRRAGRPVPTVRESADELEFANGSRIVSLPSTEGTTRGYAGARLLVIDEAARVPADVFHGVLPMVASDGVLMALSTPYGQAGWFFELWERPGSGWEKHRVTVHESVQWDEERIAEVRAYMGSHVFAADCLAEFQDTDQQLFSSQAVRAAASPAVAPLFLGGAAS